MIYLRFLLEKNGISINQLEKALKMPTNRLMHRINLKTDFSIEILNKIKDLLIDMQIIPPTSDIGEFLTMV